MESINPPDANPPTPADGDELNEKAPAGFGAPNAEVVEPNKDAPVDAPNNPPDPGAGAPKGEAAAGAPNGLAAAAGCWPNSEGAAAAAGAPNIEPA